MLRIGPAVVSGISSIVAVWTVWESDPNPGVSTIVGILIGLTIGTPAVYAWVCSIVPDVRLTSYGPEAPPVFRFRFEKPAPRRAGSRKRRPRPADGCQCRCRCCGRPG